MADTVPCNNPGHGVQNHIAGTKAARLCAVYNRAFAKNGRENGVTIPAPSIGNAAETKNRFGYLNGSIPIADVSRGGTSVVFAAVTNKFDGAYGDSKRIIVGYDGPSVMQVPHNNNARAVERADVVFGTDAEGNIKRYKNTQAGTAVEDIAEGAIGADDDDESTYEDRSLGEWLRTNLN